jgi:hypothetical protein
MKANRHFERLYELLEQFDFKDLSEKDRIYVLSEMTENEFNNMRSTLTDTETFFSNSCEPDINESLFNSLISTNHKPNILLKILNHPVKFYQLAASILLLLGLFIIKQYYDIPDNNSAIPINDTIYIRKPDSLSSKLADTVKILKQKIIYITGEKDTNPTDKLLSTATFEFTSGKIVCPGNIESIKQLDFFADTPVVTLFKN